MVCLIEAHNWCASLKHTNGVRHRNIKIRLLITYLKSLSYNALQEVTGHDEAAGGLLAGPVEHLKIPYKTEGPQRQDSEG